MQIEQIGRYKIIELLGEGGMAHVFLAYDPQFKRQVAIKLLSQGLSGNKAIREKFAAEAQLIASLEHHAIVPVYDFGEYESKPYLVMRVMTGGTLDDRIQHGKLPLKTIALVMERICSALDKAHANHVVHRDLKPGNILFDDLGMPYLADFGIARLTEATQTTTIIGTPHYMAPEQAKGGNLDGRTDVYQMGVVLFEMLTGALPFKGENASAILFQHVYEPVPQLHLYNRELPVPYQMIVEQAMAKEPSKRPSSAGAFYQLFQQSSSSMGSHSSQSPPSAVATPTPVGGISYPVWVVAGGTLVLVILFFLGVALFGNNDSDRVVAVAVASTTGLTSTIITTTIPPLTPTAEPVVNVGGTSTIASSFPTATSTPTLPVELAQNLVAPSVLPDVNVPPTPTVTPFVRLATAIGGGTGRFAYTSNALGRNYDIYTASLDSPQSATRLTSIEANDFNPVWSPDGQKILFHSYRDGNWEVYVMNGDGSNQRNLTNHAKDDSFGAWSPDSQQIVFHSNRAGSFDLYVMNADGSNIRRLTFEDDLDETYPDWSADGRSIVFRRRVTEYRQLFVIDSSGGNERRITFTNVDHNQPRWNPDNNQIVYEGLPNGYEQIFLTDINGRAPTLISPPDRTAYAPRWSPDGRWVIFHLLQPNTENRDIYMHNIQTGELVQVTTVPTEEERQPSLQP